MTEYALDRFEVWDVRRATRAELMDYARKGPYTLPTVVEPDQNGDPVKKMTAVRRWGICYHWVVSTNVHSLAYAVLWVLRQPSRALAKVKRPTLEEILAAVRETSGPAQWVNVGILSASIAAYLLLWTVERPSRGITVSVTATILRLALIAAGL